MAKKSKFKSFILSAMPGLGHIYQGFTNRGAIFMGAFICIMFTMQILQNSRGHNYEIFKYGLLNGYKNILEMSIPLIWIASIIDNLVLADKLKSGSFSKDLEENITALDLNDMTSKADKQLVAILLNVVPGAGHIYLGLKTKGIQLTCYFFLLYFAAELTCIDLLNVPVAMIWLYSILDTINLVTSKCIRNEEKEIALFEDTTILLCLKNKLNWIGGILIFTGVFIFVGRVASEFIDPEIIKVISGYLKDGIESIILIVIGIKMLFSRKQKAA